MTQALTKAISLFQDKLFDDAQKECALALTEDPKNYDAHILMAALKSREAELDTAAHHLELAVSMDPNRTDARFNLGKVYRESERYDEAVNLLEKVTDEWPDRTDAWVELGKTYEKYGYIKETISAFEKAMQLGEAGYKFWHALGTAYLNNANYEQANTALQKAVDLEPSFAPSWVNLAITLENQSQIHESIEIYQALLNLESDYHEAAFRNALALLTTGALNNGWSAYAKRHTWPRSRTSHGQCDAPFWSGESITDKSLLIWTEQGPGDEILLGSMIPDMIQKCENITIGCSDRLAPLFSRSFPDCRVVVRNENDLPQNKICHVDVQASLTELGKNLRPTLESFSDCRPYLKVEKERSNTLRAKYSNNNLERPIIGISWRSDNEVAGRHKSTQLAEWNDLISAIDADFVSLQYGETEKERKALEGLGGRHLISDPDINPMTDMDAFAHQVAAMDLVISTSNTTVHVAGALGHEVWTLVPEGTGRPWYWFLDRNDCLWYPSMRLYRQPQAGDWVTPLSAAQLDLAQWMQNWSTHRQT